MSDDSTASQDRPLMQRLKRGVETKILVPTAATIVSVAVTYLIKKLPLLLEEKVMPKLQDMGQSDQATKTLEDASAVQSSEDDRSSEEEQSSDGDSSESASSLPEPQASAGDREEERRKREQRRRERRRAIKKAA